MEKIKATQLLGGTNQSAAEAIGITPQAYGQWPDDLPRRLADRVQAALYRRSKGMPDAAPKPQEPTHA